MSILKKLKTKYEQWTYNNWVNSLDEQELTTHYTDTGFWNNPKDKSYWNRTDFESHEGLNIRKLYRKLDLMNNE